MNSLIYFNNCASTQDELIDFLNQHYLSEDFLAVYTFNQTKGRGQYGNSWENLPEENLAYSFALKTKNINISDTCFNFYTAILVRDFIANLTKTEVKIKWPNDLILKNKKICGMLFEKNKNYFVVGIGINILQENFKNLPKAGSVSRRFQYQELRQGTLQSGQQPVRLRAGVLRRAAGGQDGPSRPRLPRGLPVRQR